MKATLTLRMFTIACSVLAVACSNAKSSSGDELGSAVATHDWDKARALLQSGVSIDALNQDGNTTLFVLSHSPDHEAVRFLLENGANPNLQFKHFENWSPTMGAAKKGSKLVVELLLKHGGDVTLKNTKGETAVQIAERRGDVEVLALFHAAAGGARPEPTQM